MYHNPLWQPHTGSRYYKLWKSEAVSEPHITRGYEDKEIWSCQEVPNIQSSELMVKLAACKLEKLILCIHMCKLLWTCLLCYSPPHFNEAVSSSNWAREASSWLATEQQRKITLMTDYQGEGWRWCLWSGEVMTTQHHYTAVIWQLLDITHAVRKPLLGNAIDAPHFSAASSKLQPRPWSFRKI